MATIARFEEIEGWKKGRELARRIYAISATGKLERDFELRGQMRRAAVSILSNIAEGFERGGTKEFVQFLAIAKGSAGEIKAQLYVALDVGYINEQQFAELYGLSNEVVLLIGGLMRYLQQSELRGAKFKRSAEL